MDIFAINCSTSRMFCIFKRLRNFCLISFYLLVSENAADLREDIFQYFGGGGSMPPDPPEALCLWNTVTGMLQACSYFFNKS